MHLSPVTHLAASTFTYAKNSPRFGVTAYLDGSIFQDLDGNYDSGKLRLLLTKIQEHRKSAGLSGVLVLKKDDDSGYSAEYKPKPDRPVSGCLWFDLKDKFSDDGGIDLLVNSIADMIVSCQTDQNR